MSIDLTSLNANQREAVLWNDGPVLVLAGPGSGKTRVLTFRVARLLQEREDVSLLALTFTDKAAAEMRERVDQLLGRRADRARLSTFHAFAGELLRQHGSHVGVRPDFALVTQDEDRWALLASVATGLQEAGHALQVDRKSLVELLEYLCRESYDGGPNAPGLTHTPDWVPLLFKGYCDALLKENRQDFGTMLLAAQRLLRERPAVARVVRIGWTHVCVDEFQDTNRAQYDLLKLLVHGRDANLFLVGDDDQIIYQWNGASPERMLTLRDDFDLKVIQLPENYRCPPQIVELANQLIAHNTLRSPGKQPLVSHQAGGIESGARRNDVVRYGVYDTPEFEAGVVAQDIKNRALSPTDCVVLARATKQLETAAHALRSAGFEAHIARRKTEFQSPVVQVIYQAHRMANARADRDALRRLCSAWRRVSSEPLDVDAVVASATMLGGDLLRAWADAAAQDVEREAAALLAQIRRSLVDRLEFPQFVERFLAEGWRPWEGSGDLELADEIRTWTELHQMISNELGTDDLVLNAWLQRLDLASKASRPSPNAIRCMTVHGAKGLEFKHVYLIGMAQEVLPSFQALKKGPTSRDLEEERRNCFVAITRVQETLTLTRAQQYNGWPKGPSQFLAEMGLNVS